MPKVVHAVFRPRRRGADAGCDERFPCHSMCALREQRTVVVDPEGLAGVAVPPGSPRVPFEVNVAGRLVRGELNPKTQRAVAAVAASGDV